MSKFCGSISIDEVCDEIVSRNKNRKPIDGDEVKIIITERVVAEYKYYKNERISKSGKWFLENLRG